MLATLSLLGLPALLVVLTVVERLDPALSGLAVAIGFFVWCAAASTVHANLKLLSRRAWWCLMLTVLHATAAWYYVALRLSSAHESRRPTEIGHVALLYVLLLCLTLPFILGGAVGLAGSPLGSRVASLEIELSEQRVQYDAMCSLLQRRVSSALAGEEEELLEGDEREHLIVPPDPAVIRVEALGRPERCLPQALGDHPFDRKVALRIAQRIRQRGYSLPMYYDDVRKAFPELRLYLAQKEPLWHIGADEDGEAEVRARRTPSLSQPRRAPRRWARTCGPGRVACEGGVRGWRARVACKGGVRGRAVGNGALAAPPLVRR